ncbi:MAG TPA: multiheme c-type cytochrome [Candidatus Methanoperedens sp.]|nr:multiheme c-type cytochrome [Candidatus Methanoperedens sp.]
MAARTARELPRSCDGPGAGPTRTAAAPLLLAWLASVCAVPASGAGENPHAFMSDPAKCVDCHEAAPQRGRDDFLTVTFKDTIVNLCCTCHQEEHHREEHPIEIRPEGAVPQDLHLDGAYTVSCATCHNPHGPFEADRPYLPQTFGERLLGLARRTERYPTRFLRRPNPNGELCAACHTGGVVTGAGEPPRSGEQGFPDYIGSAACKECHKPIWDQWRRTLHATNYRDLKQDPAALRGVFTEGDSQPFAKAEALRSVGEHWTQRYLVQGKKELMVIPDTWSIQAGAWLKEGSFNRPWLKYCAGCHVTALNHFDGSSLERGTGCEGCHGPGRRHAESSDQTEIVNPGILVESRRDMICEACHTAGHDRSGNFRYPVGYLPGADLMRYYRGLVPKPGQDVANYKGDNTYEDRHRQFLYWISRVNILVGVTCDVCSADRRAAAEMEGKDPEYRLSPDEMCGTCHREIKKGQQAHAGHAPEVAGCIDCHVPLLDATRTRYSIHDHKFQFGPPRPDHVAGGDPCEGCHERTRARGRRAPRSLVRR